MNALISDPVMFDLSRYLGRLDTEDKKAAFLEATPWSEIINLAEADIDDILDSYYMGRKSEADRIMEKAKDKAWERILEINERDRYEQSRSDH